MKKVPKKHSHTVIALCLTGIFLAAALFGGTGLVLLKKEQPLPLTASTIFPLLPELSATRIEGKAAILYDPANGRILFQKNAREPLPLASITKLMTAQLLLTVLDPSVHIPITNSTLAKHRSEVDKGFKPGDSIPLQDLLRYGLIASSNVAIESAAESLGDDYIDQMNAIAHNLELSQTTFINPTGLDFASTSGAYASAYDVARLAALFYTQHPQYFTATKEPQVSITVGSRTLTSEATALPLASIPGFIGAKTGYTDQAGGNLVAVFDIEIGHPLIAVVLGSTREGRFSDIRTLITAARSASL